MASIIICGGSAIGLTTAMMLADDGHAVTVLEADPASPPNSPVDAWTAWERHGVPQFRQPHNLFPGFRRVAETELPGLTERLVAAGCVWEEPLAGMPPGITDHSARPDDDKFRFVTGRRPVVEAVIADKARGHPGVTVRRGTKVSGVITGTSMEPGVLHVTGVRTAGGDEIRADLVIDAMGRKTPCGDWLTAAGGTAPHVESQDCGFAYYTRYYTGPSLPAKIGPVLSELGSFTLLTLAGDNNTWSLTIFVATADPALKAFRDADAFTAVIRECPLQAHWLDGTPITDVLPYAGVLDRYRRFVVGGRPVATGFAAVGDAWACTNPSAGRGLSVGIIHAQVLRDALRKEPDNPLAFVHAYDAETEKTVAPFYWNQITADRRRIDEMTALREGTEPPPPDPRVVHFMTAAMCDGDVFRGLLETITCLSTPQQVLARPDIAAKVQELGTDHMFQLPGPGRARLLDLLGVG
jgi:2-polyprenyl-6-methoxyphenol hydroxylase-like FAD-dependent oxidoreductase